MRPPSMITTTNNDGLPSLKVQNTTINNNNNNSNIINNNQKLLSSESDGRIYSKAQNVEIINYKKYRSNHDNFINNLTKTLSKNHHIISNPIADINNRASSSSADAPPPAANDVRLKRIASDINCYNLDTNSCGSELLDSKNFKNKPLSDYTISTNVKNNNNIIVNKLNEVDGETIPLLLYKPSSAVNASAIVTTTVAISTPATTTTTTTTTNIKDSIIEFDLKTKNLQNVVIHRNRDLGPQRITNNKKTTLRNNRRSLQLPVHATSDCVSNNNTEHTNYSKRRQQIHSWYAYGYETLFEELEQEKKKIQNQNMSRIPLIHAELEKLAEETSSESGASDDEYTVDFKDNIHYHNNLAGAKNTFINGARESASLIENNSNNLVHSSRSRRSNGGNYINTQQQHIQSEGPHVQSLGGPSQPTRRKVGQFLKSLVSRKTAKDNLNATPPLLPHNEQKEEKQQLPLQQSPANSLTNLTQTKRVGNSTTSLNIVNQKLWSVVPLFRRETSSSSLNQALKPKSPDHESSLRKCNTVLALTQTASSFSFEPMRPLNRLRNYTSIGTCSRCSSLLSVAAGSKYSLNVSNGFIAVSDGETSPILESSSHEKLVNITCKLCLGDVKLENLTKISQCGCSFCTECMTAYVEFEILEGAYEISCPDAMCPSQGILTIAEIMLLASNSLIEKHQRYRLNREIELDINRTWCPKAGCETVCLVQTSNEKAVTLQPSSSHLQAPCAVHCPTCEDDFCSGCKKAWHPTMSCEENTRRLAADGLEDEAGIPFDGDLIKCCPMCAVPIEKDEGCAQMMCKRCKHVFCWYCLASLDDDFLLRHYDKGPCKNKLGHSRASVVWHRAQVIGIFAGFGILLLVASPLLLLAAPCIVCCKCRICSGAAKLEENENEFDDVVALQR